MDARSDDVPDFYATEPRPDDSFDPWGKTRRESCIHGDACIYAAWWVADRECDGEDPDGTASDAVTDGHCCAECGLYEPKGSA